MKPDYQRLLIHAIWAEIRDQLRLTPSGNRWEANVNGRWVRTPATAWPAAMVLDGLHAVLEDGDFDLEDPDVAKAVTSLRRPSATQATMGYLKYLALKDRLLG